MKSFRTYQLAKELYKQARSVSLKNPIKDQFERAILSVVLNLAEGSAKDSRADRFKFYQIAMGSLREAQAIIDLMDLKELEKPASAVGASLWCLNRTYRPQKTQKQPPHQPR